MWIVLLVLAAAALLVLFSAWLCFYITFYVPKKEKTPKAEFDLPRGKIYEPYAEDMIRWIKEVRALPREELQIVSDDGLVLKGNYYEYAPGAPIELMFHGYRGAAERDLCGGVQRCFRLGHSALLVDQRAASKSEGKVITFGVQEHRDCLKWAELAQERFGEDAKVILCGISMGATTVLMAAGEELPKCVVGVLADCGFSSAKEIICKVIRQIHLPQKLVYPLIRLGAKLYGGFNLEDSDATRAMARCRLPVLFFHGTEDDFVPWQMSQKNFEACAAQKKLVLVPGAGHGLSYLLDPQGYLAAVREFEPYWGINRKETTK
jgi:pimeloyl-ACP methyl ester carboxylesterase